MEIRNWQDLADLEGALAARDRAWTVGYRGVVDQPTIDAAVVDDVEAAAESLAEALDDEAGKLLVAVEEREPASEGQRASEQSAASAADGDETATDTTDAETGEDAAGGGDSADDAADEDARSHEGPRVIGYVRVRWGATASHVGPMDGEIVELYVDPARWREGVASALLAAGEDWVPGLLDGLSLTVLESNERGRAFLEAQGFERADTVVEEIGDEEHDALVYQRSI